MVGGGEKGNGRRRTEIEEESEQRETEEERGFTQIRLHREARRGGEGGGREEWRAV